MKAQKLPRKLKKSLKANLLNRLHPGWKPKELTIVDYSLILYRSDRKQVYGYKLGR